MRGEADNVKRANKPVTWSRPSVTGRASRRRSS